MSDLTTLKKDLKEKKYEDLAEIIIKYQNFKTFIILDKTNNLLSCREDTQRQYITAGLNYIKFNKQDKRFSNIYYEKIDDLLNKHLQPLTPKEDEKRKNIERKYRKKEAILPITKVIENITNKQKISSKIEYGIKQDNLIMLYKSIDEAKIALNTVKFLNPNIKINIITVEIEDYKEMES